MVTVNDVAKLAGVSRGTVSDVISHVRIGPGYQGKVGQTIKDLGHVLNTYVRSLRSSRTHTVTLILLTAWFPFLSRLTNDAEQGLRRRDYKLLLYNSQDNYYLELEYVSMAKENRVDGILSITYNNIAPCVTDANIPMMVIECYSNAHIPFVSTDNFQDGVMIAQKLLELGCRRSVFIGRLSDKNGVTKLHRDEFVSYCQKNDVPFIELYSESDSQGFILEIGRFVEQEFKNNTPWDGVFTVADRYAEYMIDSLRSHSCPAVPGHTLQIIGLDGTKNYTNDRIQIFSIRQPMEDIAAYAVDTLCRQIAGEEVEYYKLFPVTFTQGRTARI